VGGAEDMNIARIVVLGYSDAVPLFEPINSVSKLPEGKVYYLSNGNFSVPFIPKMYIIAPPGVVLRLHSDGIEGIIGGTRLKADTVEIGSLFRMGNKHVPTPQLFRDWPAGIYKVETSVSTESILRAVNLRSSAVYTEKIDVLMLASAWAKNFCVLFDELADRDIDIISERLMLLASLDSIPQSAEEQLRMLVRCDEDGMPTDVLTPGLDIITTLYNWSTFSYFYKIDELCNFYQTRKDLLESLDLYDTGGRNLTLRGVTQQKQATIFDF